jgi:epoxyqueuosine reductase
MRGKELGFREICIADANAAMTQAESGLLEWLNKGYHGEMDYMVKHGYTAPVRLTSLLGRCGRVRYEVLPAVQSAASAISNGCTIWRYDYAMRRHLRQ